MLIESLACPLPVAGAEAGSVQLVLNELWRLFSITNGNPDCNYSGIRFGLGMFFSFLLVYVVKMRTLNSWEIRHFIALIGGCFLLIRHFVMMVFLWGYEIQLYDNQILRFLFPPVEHLFETIAFACFGFYSIVTTRPDHATLSKRSMAVIPIILLFYIYVFVAWQDYFFTFFPAKVMLYYDSVVDWQSHFVITSLAAVAVYNVIKNVKLAYPLLTIFWAFTVLEHSVQTVVSFYRFEPSWLVTIFNAMHLWTIPVLMLHFVYGYSRRLKGCETCIKQKAKAL
jgi:hypothetical protein